MVGPDYERPQTPLPIAYPDATHVRRPPRRRVRAGLVDAVRRPDAQRPRRDRARRQPRRASRRSRESRRPTPICAQSNAALFPEIDLGGAATRAQLERHGDARRRRCRLSNDLRLALSTSFEIDFWGKLRRQVESARAQALGDALREATSSRCRSLGSRRRRTSRCARSTRRSPRRAKRSPRARSTCESCADAPTAGSPPISTSIRRWARARTPRRSSRTSLGSARWREHLLGTLTGNLDLALAPGDLAQLPVPPRAASRAAVDAARAPSRHPRCRAESRRPPTPQIGVAKAALLPAISLTGDFGGESRSLELAGAKQRQASGRSDLRCRCRSSPRGALNARSGRVDGAREKQAVAGYQKSIQTAFREVADALVNVEQTAAAEQRPAGQRRCRAQRAAALDRALRSRLLRVSRSCSTRSARSTSRRSR